LSLGQFLKSFLVFSHFEPGVSYRRFLNILIFSNLKKIKSTLKIKLTLEKALAYITYWMTVYPPLLTRASTSKYLWQSVVFCIIYYTGMGDILKFLKQSEKILIYDIGEYRYFSLNETDTDASIGIGIAET
jgi:hypothetical protein